MLEYNELQSMLLGITNTFAFKGDELNCLNQWSHFCNVLSTVLATPTPSADDIKSVGFPQLNEMQINHLLSLDPPHLHQFIEFIGYQLASEAYLFSKLSVRKKESMSIKSRNLLRGHLLARNQKKEKFINILKAFVKDVLSYYENLILVALDSEKLSAFLQQNNLCDEEDLKIISLFPDDLSVGNYVSLRQELHQLTLMIEYQDSSILKSNDNDGHDAAQENVNQHRWSYFEEDKTNALLPYQDELGKFLVFTPWFERFSVRDRVLNQDFDSDCDQLEMDSNAVAKIQKWWRNRREIFAASRIQKFWRDRQRSIFLQKSQKVVQYKVHMRIDRHASISSKPVIKLTVAIFFAWFLSLICLYITLYYCLALSNRSSL